MALLYDGHLQNLVIVGFHVLNPTKTSTKQTIKYRHLLGKAWAQSCVNQYYCLVEMPAFQRSHLSFLMVVPFSKLMGATITQ
jgi:hypothetical protein